MFEKLKKAALVLLIAIAAASFGACGKKAETPAASTASAVEFPGGWKPTVDYSKRLDIAEAFVGTTDGYDYTNGDEYVKWFTSRFNVDLEVTSLGWDNWHERTRIWISSGDMPDVVLIDYNHADAASWIEQGLLKKFPDNWQQRWPNLARSFNVTGLGPQLDKTFGGTYVIPRPRFESNLPHDPVPNHLSWYFRKDWAEAVGFPVKSMYTISEILEYGRLIKERDPGKVGASLVPFTVVPSRASVFFIERVSTHYNNFYKGPDDRYRWGAADAATLEGLKLYYQAFSQGILDREFYSLPNNADNGKCFVAGNAASVYTNAPSVQLTMNWANFRSNVGDPDKLLNVATVLGPDNLYHQEDLINYWGCVVFSPEISDEKFERYMDMMDFGCSDEGFYIHSMGIEGVDWRRDGDNFVSLLPEGVTLNGAGGKYPSMSDVYVMGQVKLYDDFSFQSPAYPENLRNLSWKLYEDRCANSTPATFTPTDWKLFSFDSPSKRRVNFDYATAYANIVTNARSEADVETLWQRWLADNKALVDPVLSELDALN
jgi:putative aldouronate transport system substrate-binding protein